MSEALQTQRTVVLKDEGLKQFEGGFTAIPNRILENNGLTLGARMTYAMLLKYAWQRDFCFPAQERIAADLGVTDRSVRTFLNELRDAKIIMWKQQGLNRPNVYYILKLPERTPLNGHDQSGPEDISGLERQPVSAQDRQSASDKEHSMNNTQKNVNVVENLLIGSHRRDRSTGAISERALANHYGFNQQQVDETQALVNLQLDVLGAGDRNHAAYVKRAAEAVRDGIANILRLAIGDLKDTNHRKAIVSLPAYFTRVYDAMREEALRSRPAAFATISTSAPAALMDETEELRMTQRERLLEDIAAKGYPIPHHIRRASISEIAAWYDQVERTHPNRP
ncbi:MAG: helix-turn-helix domain-containing protein [Candidatus Binatia bacterium]